MFEKYKASNDKFVRIPLPNGKEPLYVSEDGQVLSHRTGLLPIGYDNKGFRTVEVDLWNGHAVYKVALITLIAYSKLKLPWDFLDQVEPFHIDGNKNNLHPSNIGYRYKQPIECAVEPGYYYVPFYNAYAISREGELICWITGKIQRKNVVRKSTVDNPKNIKGGYVYFSAKSDVGTRSAGRHRMMALTFIPYPDNVDKLDVNHIDGIPGNDTLDNLEWVSRKANVEHAYRSGLRSQNFTVYAKNVFTGEEHVFYSATEAARVINGVTVTICERVKDPSQTIYTGGWLFKTDSKVPWRIVEDPVKELKALSNPSRVKSYNVFTGVVRYHDSINRVGSDLELDNIQAPKTQLLKGYTRPYQGYLFKLADDETPWPEFSERELAVFRDNPTGHARGVIAKKVSGEELFFTNIIKAAEYFHQAFKSKNDVIKAIARKRIVDGYQLNYL